MTPSAQHRPSDTVTLLMGVYNGARYLPEQLQSIAVQSHDNWHLVVSDDGSTDGSGALLKAFGSDHPGKLTVRDGPQKGFSINFMKLIRDLPNEPGYVSLADQDDIWMPDKIARGIAALQGSDDIPTLYAARRWYWNPATDHRHASPLNTRACRFTNALIENVASGNTILLNPAAAQLARTAARQTDVVYAHDWWLYLLITGAGGRVHFDNGPPCVLYRQHDANLIGAGHGLGPQIMRKTMVLRGAFSERMKDNIAALEQAGDLLTPEHRQVLAKFKDARAAGLIARYRGLRRIKPYRQSVLGNIGFWGAVGLGRI